MMTISDNGRRRSLAMLGAGVALMAMAGCRNEPAASKNEAASVSVAPTTESAPAAPATQGQLAVQKVADTDVATPPTPATLFADADYQAALTVWRVPRFKDSCVSCHGPDFFDLARVGTSDADIIRRAIGDGTTQAEAETLLRGIKTVRAAYKLPVEDPRSFRPLQPGGAVLPGATAVERDAALGEELTKIWPTVGSVRRISTYSQAVKARNELLATDFNKVKIGIPFPLWSADIAHGAQEGTTNDWIADLPRVPKPERKAEWTALQDDYLRDPSTFNFWRVYAALNDMTQPANFVNPADPADKSKAETFTLFKYRSTLIGQHAMRTAALGRNDFTPSQIAFSYLSKEDRYLKLFGKQSFVGNGGVRLPQYLPNPMWEVGDFSRTSMEPSALTAGQIGNRDNVKDPHRDQLRLLGFPQFVIDSVDPAAQIGQNESDVKLAWFMIGYRFDPGMQRVNGSNSTRVAEYLLSELTFRDYFIHRSLIAFVRQIADSYNPDAPTGAPLPFKLYFSYFTGYHRHVPSRWNAKEAEQVSSTVKARQMQLYKQLTANLFRMSLLLHEDALNRGEIKPYGNINSDGDFAAIKEFFDYAGLPNRADDYALMRRVAKKAGKTIDF